MARQRRTPTLPSLKAWREATTIKMAEAARRRARAYTRSSTMRRALFVAKRRKGYAVGVPHYWAVHYHDGRGSVHPTRARWLVYFDNPKRNDPRLKGGYPVTQSQARRLTKAEWEHGLRMNRQRAKAGRRPFMIVTRVSGPTTPGVTSDPFLDNGFIRAEKEFHAIAKAQAEWLLDHIAVHNQETVRVRL